jgi:hypothetical protein
MSPKLKQLYLLVYIDSEKSLLFGSMVAIFILLSVIQNYILYKNYTYLSRITFLVSVYNTI